MLLAKSQSSTTMMMNRWLSAYGARTTQLIVKHKIKNIFKKSNRNCGKIIIVNHKYI